MTSNYKRLGGYIRQVDVRNKGLKVEMLVGLTVNKAFIPSVANTIGTDLSNYKIIRKGQFACSLMQVSRDGKMPVAMLDIDEAIMSPAYPMFEVVDNTILLPEYLMMWFSRAEFDREASYYAVGGVRGSLTWEDFCDMTLPVPSIDCQRKLVAQYESLSRRIRINEQMIATLEDTAQTLYRKMFVEGIDKENLPEGWRMGTLREVCEVNTDNITSKSKVTTIHYLDTGNITCNNIEQLQIINCLVEEVPSRAKRLVKYNDIVYSTVRPNLNHYGLIKINDDKLVVSTGFAVLRSVHPLISNELLLIHITNKDNTERLQGIAEMSKATYPSITADDLLNLPIPIPSCADNKTSMLQNGIIHVFSYCAHLRNENSKLADIKSVKLSTIS